MRFAGIVLISAAMTCTAAVYAHSGATGIVKQRMDAMSDMGDHAKKLADMFKGKIAFDADSVRVAAESFVEHGRQMIDWFPDTKDSRFGHKSQSEQAIWEQWDDFVEEADEFLAVSESMLETARHSDKEAVLRKAYFAAAKGCKQCHKVYRKPKSK